MKPKNQKGKVKKEDADSENEDVGKSKKLGKKIMLSQAEQEQLEYLEKFPGLRVRNAPSSLFSSIRESKFDMGPFLTDIGFQSFRKIYIDQLPSKLGRLVVANFKTATNKIDLLNGLSIDVTPEKIRDMLGIPFGGSSLFSFDERPIDHPFVRYWVQQFYPKSLKEIRTADVARKLVTATVVDNLFKLNFVMLFANTMGRCETMKGQLCLDVVRYIPEDLPISDIDWCGYIHSCLQYSSNPKGDCHYTGPLAVLMVSL